ncbi:MAG: ribonuclease R [candidate division KSB1 bacterium]|nr:ribonuclease R [candidate division KSB1 bacterium]
MARRSGFEADLYLSRVLDFLRSRPGQGFKAKELAREIGVPPMHYTRFRSLLREMAERGELRKGRHARYSLAPPEPEVTGTLHVKTQGYGYVVCEDGREVFVSQRNMGTALPKDVVRVRLFATRNGERPEGRVVEVLERARENIVGTYRRGKRFGFVVPDDLKVQWDILVADTDNLGAVSGQKVVVRITEWEDERANPVGKVVKVLGFPEEPGVDVASVAYSYDLPLSFPEKVLREAERLPEAIPEGELERRLDLRDLVTFTIDPAEAKDFDDAVSLRRLESGNWELGVHIADVSYYVKEGGAIDKEARSRGTSVYLVDRVIPMLPERLSNQICSLQPLQDRLCMSVLMELDREGELLNYRIEETVIRSRRRYTYEEVQDILEGRLDDEYAEILRQMRELSRILIAKRYRRGSIDFDTPEVEVELTPDGRVRELRRRDRLESHRLIEEFMLLANETVAKHVGVYLRERSGEEVPFVYRVHERPSTEKMAEFLQLLRAFGVEVAMPGRVTPRFFQRLVEQVKDRDVADIVQDAMIRAMMKARYDVQNLGHFGLNYEYYTHFTSPIRRYPDLVVHRLLKRYRRGALSAARDGLQEICQLATRREILAMEAERESIKLKQVEYMAQHLGERFQGVVARVVPFGVFVHLPQFLVDGLVHVSELGNDYYHYDPQRFALIGENSGKVLRLGDRVTVEVVRADKNERILDFRLVEPESRRAPRTATVQRKGHRGNQRRRA